MNRFIIEDRPSKIASSLCDRVMTAFKRGVLHGLLYQKRDDEESHEYYRQGYNFGMDIYHGTVIYKGELKPKNRRIDNESK